MHAWALPGSSGTLDLLLQSASDVELVPAVVFPTAQVTHDTVAFLAVVPTLNAPFGQALQESPA
jgi:hypothetical protein